MYTVIHNHLKIYYLHYAYFDRLEAAVILV